MGTENSSKETRDRAKELSNEIGSYHIDLNMDTVVASVQALFSLVTNRTPRFKVHDGSQAENLALQNIQVPPILDSNDTGSLANGFSLLICSITSLGQRSTWWSISSGFI